MKKTKCLLTFIFPRKTSIIFLPPFIVYINEGTIQVKIFINKRDKQRTSITTQRRERKMATSGTYVTKVSLKGSAEKHHKRWKNENQTVELLEI